MSHQDKTIWKAVLAVIGSISVIAASVWTVAGIKNEVEANTLLDTQRDIRVAALESSITNFTKSLDKQSQSITKLEAYFEYGLTERLQLDKDKIERHAAELIASSTK